jgi:hypothetical protein
MYQQAKNAAFQEIDIMLANAEEQASRSLLRTAKQFCEAHSSTTCDISASDASEMDSACEARSQVAAALQRL